VSDKLKSLLKQVNSAAGEVIATIHATDAKIAELQAQRQQIGDAPVSRAEWLEYIGAEIDRKAGSFGTAVRRIVGSIDASFFALERLARFPGDLLAANRNVPFPMIDEACYWYLKPAIMARMGEIADELDLPEDAIPLAKRREMIAEIDAEIQRLRNERNDMAAQLQKAGIVR
jgi:chorismate mutase